MSKKSWLYRYIDTDQASEIMPRSGFAGASKQAYDLQIKYGISHKRAFRIIVFSQSIVLITGLSLGVLIFNLSSALDSLYLNAIFLPFILVGVVLILPIYLRKLYQISGIMPKNPQSKSKKAATRKAIKLARLSWGSFIVRMAMLGLIFYILLYVYTRY